MRVAMIVIDSNEVCDDRWREKGIPSPHVHPAIASVIEGLKEQKEIELHVVFGNSRIAQIQSRESDGITYTAVPTLRVNFPGMGGGLVGRFFGIQKYLKELKPDLVHGQGTEREAGLVAAFCGFPSVLTLHGNFRELRKIFTTYPLDYHWCAGHLETLVLLRIQAIICISGYVKNITKGFSKPQYVIPNPVDKKFLSIERPVRGPRPRLICMGSIDERKRTLFILNACEILWQEGHDFELHVYGGQGWEGKYNDKFLSAIQPAIDNGQAFYHGFTETPEQAISNADIMLSASIEESFGMNILEAMAAGTPVVAPAIGGICDIVEAGKTGLLYAPEDLSAFAGAIRRILCEEELSNTLSRAGRIRAKAHFSPEVVANQTIAAYRSILKAAGK